MLADVARWIGVAVGVLGAFVVSPDGTRLLLGDLIRWISEAPRRARTVPGSLDPLAAPRAPDHQPLGELSASGTGASSGTVTVSASRAAGPARRAPDGCWVALPSATSVSSATSGGPLTWAVAGVALVADFPGCEGRGHHPHPLYLFEGLGTFTVVTNSDKTPRVIAYVRVSTDEQAGSRAGLAAQRSAIAGEVARRGWKLLDVVEDAGYSAATLDRPGLTAVLARLDRREADVLLAAKLDRLSRSVHDFTGLMRRAERQRWALRVLDVDVDTSTPSGALFAHVVSAISEYERALIGQRTRDALAAKRAAGVVLGRPVLLDPAVAHRIHARRAAGATLQAITDELNVEGVSTPTGRRWSPALVRKVVVRGLVEGKVA